MNLSLLSKYKSAFTSYWFGRISLKYPPLFYSIEATNVCNYRCTYCPQGNPNAQGFKKGQMSTVLFESILRQIAGLRPVSQVYLTGNGEPLMHPALEEFISISNKYGFILAGEDKGPLGFRQILSDCRFFSQQGDLRNLQVRRQLGCGPHQS